MVTNGDPWTDTRVTRIRFDWTYFQQKVEGTSWEDIYVDWITWNGCQRLGLGRCWITWQWTDMFPGQTLRLILLVLDRTPQF